MSGFGGRMSQQLINAYLRDLATLRRIGGTTEGVTSDAFRSLLQAWCRPLGFNLISQHAFTTTAKVNNRVDGAIMLERFPIGYWEAKDEDDDLDVEIEKKFRRGYPKTNIIFEDTHRAVLWQHGKFVMDCAVTDGSELGKLLDIFFGYEREETTNFKKAVAQFKVDLPSVLDLLREQIDAAQANIPAFQSAASAFLKQAKETINPSVTAEDVREMLIQHILTENIFAKVFGDDEFHRKNNVAQALYALEDTFFSGDVRRRTLSKLSTYYAAIESAAALITSHSEKQGFLKAIYEGFYKVYNAKAADRLGVVYTPNEIVRFMVESADWLCETHFKKNLIDRDVEILDPATGTGTFIVELLEHFSGQPEKLKHKYAEELHANEVAILPYYVANLNIEATYAAITDEYKEFPNLCFVDTLDNTAGLKRSTDVSGDLFGGVSDENIERIRRQNEKKITVIIGNPPYNANQQSENDNNQNRKYPAIDKRIKATYIKESTAQKTKLYDMYSRFFRWASDRVEKNSIIAFVSNSSFVDAKTYDGFRKLIAEDFNEIWIVDLKGNARTKGDRRKREGANIFSDQIKVGIAVWVAVKREGVTGCRIFYQPVRDYAKLEEKRAFRAEPMRSRKLDEIKPDAKFRWIDQPDNDFEDMIAIASSETKRTKIKSQELTIFKTYGNGVNTARDQWVVDRSWKNLTDKVRYFLRRFREHAPDTSNFDDDIKWSRNLKDKLAAGRRRSVKAKQVREYEYRPFDKRFAFLNPLMIDERGATSLFDIPGNRTINLPATGQFYCLASDRPTDFHFIGDTRVFGRIRAGAAKARSDNITDWAMTQFTDRYGKAAAITKDDIFAYVYAVLHDPVYRETYALNLKREFPRIPLYPDLKRWRDWGQALLDLHIGYETAAPAPLTRTDTPDPKRAPDTTPVVRLKSDPDKGIIVLDADTKLSGVPPLAWRYRLGNRSAIDWVLDQHKEKKPKDPTIAAKFNTYRFADYKEHVVDLLARVVTVSVETVAITDAMAALPTSAREQKKAEA